MKTLNHDFSSELDFRVIGKEVRFLWVRNDKGNKEKLKKLLLRAKNLPFGRDKIDDAMAKFQNYVFEFKLLDLFIEFRSPNKSSFYEKREVLIFSGFSKEPKHFENAREKASKKKMDASLTSVFVKGNER